MSEPYHVFPGSPAHESPEKFKIKLKFNSFLQIVNIFKRTKPSHFYNVINYDSQHFSRISIKNLNTIYLLSNAPLFLTTGTNIP